MKLPSICLPKSAEMFPAGCLIPVRKRVLSGVKSGTFCLKKWGFSPRMPGFQQFLAALFFMISRNDSNFIRHLFEGALGGRFLFSARGYNGPCDE